MKTLSASRPCSFLKGGGEMAELINIHNWSLTSLGDFDNWPQSLKTTLSIILNSKFPMFLFWGPEHLCFYNDAYRPSLGNDGKHPYVLGKPGEKAWPETWQIIYPIINRLLTGGPGSWEEDSLIPIYRNGKIEDVYWTFSYSSVYDDSCDPAGVFVTCSETTEKVINLRQLQESKDQLEFAIEATELATWDLNPVTNTFTANERYTEWFGVPALNDTDNDLALKVIADEDRQRVIDAFTTALDYFSGAKYDIEYKIRPLNKPERILRAKGKAWFNEDKICTRFNGTLQDVTEQALARQKTEEIVAARTKELADLNKELKQNNQELEQFAYVASHDLQEPLRKVSTFSEMLEMHLGKGDERASFFLERIKISSRRMTQLIHDVLNFSQLTYSRKIFEPVNLNEVIEGIQSDMELMIIQKGAGIKTDKLPTLDALPLQMQQLFSNLLSNGLKFSHPDVPPQIIISSRRLTDNEMKEHKELLPSVMYYLITVVDNGIGFKAEYSEKIFNIFQRLHTRSDYEGTGIGLALSKKIVQNHHGKIWAEPNPDQGAVFNILLPVRQMDMDSVE